MNSQTAPNRLTTLFVFRQIWAILSIEKYGDGSMKRKALILLIVGILSLVASLSTSKNKPKITLLSSHITQINTAAVINVPEPPIAEPAEQWRTVQMRVTAYCPCPKCCGPEASWITASGHKIQPGETFVAADKRYSFGTEMIVPGHNNYKPVKVLDRGGAIRGNHIDIFFTSHQQALNWGVKLIDVKILTN